TSARVDGPRVIGNGEVEDAVNHQGSGFDRGVADSALRAHIRDAVEPRERKTVDVGGVDVGERAEAAARVIAVVRGPVLRRKNCGESKYGDSATHNHLSVTR